MPRFSYNYWGLFILTGTDPTLFIYYQGQTLVLLTGTDPFYLANQVMAEPISPANRYGDRPLTFYRAEPNYPGLVRGQTPHFLMEIDFFIADSVTDLLFLIPTVSGEVEKIPVSCTKLNSHF